MHRVGVQSRNFSGYQKRTSRSDVLALKARQAKERMIRSKVGDTRLKAIALTRTTSLGDLPACVAIDLPPEPVNGKTVALVDLKKWQTLLPAYRWA